MNLTILIAGGAGFIGSNLISKLLNEGNKVICLDNLYTGKFENIKEFIDNENFIFLEKDILEPILIEGKIDQIYNLACPASPLKYQKDPIYTLKINFNGNLNLLELARNKKSTILLSSTSEIYGEPEISPQNELYRGNVNTIGIRSCYDEGKRIAETLFMEFHRKYNVDIRIVRIFNTFGPKMDKYDGRVVTNFINQMLNNQDITIYGDGNQTRSFCYIDDLVDGLVKLMNSNYLYPVNIGNNEELTINYLVEILSSLITSSSKIKFLELPKDDPTNRKPDISIAKEVLKWEPKIKLEEGLIKTINYLKNS